MSWGSYWQTSEPDRWRILANCWERSVSVHIVLRDYIIAHLIHYDENAMRGQPWANLGMLGVLWHCRRSDYIPYSRY
jgi:hypothetical protein